MSAWSAAKVSRNFDCISKQNIRTNRLNICLQIREVLDCVSFNALRMTLVYERVLVAGPLRSACILMKPSYRDICLSDFETIARIGSFSTVNHIKCTGFHTIHVNAFRSELIGLDYGKIPSTACRGRRGARFESCKSRPTD
jgi:hypothetical protein